MSAGPNLPIGFIPQSSAKRTLLVKQPQRIKLQIMNNCIAPEPAQESGQVHRSSKFSDLSRLAMQFRIPSNVRVESRILHEFSALTLGEHLSTAEAVLSTLAFRRPLLNEGTMSVCLVRRRDGNNVVADLKVYSRVDVGHPAVILRLGKVRQL